MSNTSFPEKFCALPDIRYAAVVNFGLNHRNEWHNSLRSDLIYVISGNITVILPGVNELQYPASPGDILIMKGQLPHKDIFKTSKGLKALIISYQWSGDKDFFAVGKGFAIRKFESAKNREICWQLESMRESLAQNNVFYTNDMIANSRLHTILLMLYNIMVGNDVQNTVPSCKLEEILRSAENYICRNYNSSSLTRAEVASVLNVSVPTLSRAFERYSGYTFLEYLTQIRLDAAKKLLQDGTSTVSEIAQLCGFADAGYFARVFKKYFGISPKKYR